MIFHLYLTFNDGSEYKNKNVCELFFPSSPFSIVYRSIHRSMSVNQYEGSGTKTVNMFSKLVSQGSSFVMEGVKNLVVKRHVSYANIDVKNLF